MRHTPFGRKPSKGHQVPDVEVDEAKRAALRDAQLKAFDFIVYLADGDNWLVRVGRPTHEQRDGMRGWQDVFGAGFRAVFAVPDGEFFRFRDLDGAPLALPELEG